MNEAKERWPLFFPSYPRGNNTTTNTNRINMDLNPFAVRQAPIPTTAIFDFNTFDDDSTTCSNNDIDLLSLYDSGPNLLDDYRFPLHAAAQAGDLDRIRSLITRRHIDPACINDTLATPLHVAADTSTVALLCELGADPNKPDLQGRTPLHLAVQRHRFEHVRLLLDHGACPNMRVLELDRDVDPANSLHLALETRARVLEPLVRLLIDHRVSVNDRLAKKSGTPLHMAVRNSNTILNTLCNAGKGAIDQEEIDQNKVVRLLIANGADKQALLVCTPSPTSRVAGSIVDVRGIMQSDEEPFTAWDLAEMPQLKQLIERAGTRFDIYLP